VPSRILGAFTFAKGNHLAGRSFVFSSVRNNCNDQTILLENPLFFKKNDSEKEK
jgi:hypothetical protein